MKTAWNSLHLGVTHFLLFYIAIFLVTPGETPLYPMVIWSGMIIFSGLIVQFYLNKTIRNKSAGRLRKNHKKTQKIALISALLFLISCVSFKLSNYISIMIPGVLMFMTAISIICTIIYHIKSIDNKEKTIATRVKLVVKYSWIIVSLISYYLARSLTSNSWDIHFDSTSNKLTTVVTALIIIFIFYYAIYFIFIALLYFVTLHKKNIKKKTSVDSNHSISIFAPLFIIGYISFIAFNVQTLNVIKFGFGFSIKYDTRDTFFCSDRYMLLNKHPDARFMFISEGNYRALIPHNDDYYVSRLTCTKSEPFYSLISVVEKKDIILAALKARSEVFSSDVKAIISGDAHHFRKFSVSDTSS
ncbi:hypothetical protein [Shimwellia blattae]|uniref:Uncharacterized protein n=1 Tax=Shimwellia blattae (strain ATCC 29907 / DSM 4481 / JCM 1650 / NBRC 105725 / CDC 9005-74) TaxID=630626 RepID=I2B9I6_SHIBC|nr:hypothetical protein [Shimwellia blattae]AFJ47190.1 hypothetical protein EBL_c20990 [Shimwellia blattae DSM 4481 = NBRC 105725]GAB82281.1 hypothetical protein EB105725_21_00795 [Shimwellia blattae DSM 4481 = NBRC 105725]VDY64678.1 Uncharacterised protein [Shimwellia blattae]VEC22782.1 Uncharacterised protein [Shimwellia blattae]